MNHKAYILEAIDSYKTLFANIGIDTKANLLMLKWPDLAISLVDKDNKQFLDDATQLICIPIKIMIDAMDEYCEKHGGPKFNKNEIVNIMNGAIADPIGAKKKLVVVLHIRMRELKKLGWDAKIKG